MWQTARGKSENGKTIISQSINQSVGLLINQSGCPPVIFHSVSLSASLTVSQSADHSFTHSVSWSDSQPVILSLRQSTGSQSFFHSITRLVSQSFIHSLSLSVIISLWQSISQSVIRSVILSLSRSVCQPVNLSLGQSVSQSASQ